MKPTVAHLAVYRKVGAMKVYLDVCLGSSLSRRALFPSDGSDVLRGLPEGRRRLAGSVRARVSRARPPDRALPRPRGWRPFAVVHRRGQLLDDPPGELSGDRAARGIVRVAGAIPH